MLPPHRPFKDKPVRNAKPKWKPSMVQVDPLDAFDELDLSPMVKTPRLSQPQQPLVLKSR